MTAQYDQMATFASQAVRDILSMPDALSSMQVMNELMERIAAVRESGEEMREPLIQCVALFATAGLGAALKSEAENALAEMTLISEDN